jgi:cyclin B
MDRYISRTRKILYDSDMFLIGLTCIYIASKVMDIIPLKLFNIANNIGRGEFLNKDIIYKEKEISMTINYDFIVAGIYDFLMAFFYNLNVKNYKKINELDAKEIISDYMDFCIVLGKLVLYNEYLLSYKTSLISVTILTLGFDILNLKKKNINLNLRNFLANWIYYIRKELDIIPYDAEIVYKILLQVYNDYIYQPIKQINKKRKTYVEKINLIKYYKDKLL